MLHAVEAVDDDECKESQKHLNGAHGRDRWVELIFNVAEQHHRKRAGRRTAEEVGNRQIVEGDQEREQSSGEDARAHQR